MAMALIHDIVEIDAGDTYAYDESSLASQKERESKAADRLFGLLPPDQGRVLRDLFEEFEANESAEAKFAHVADNFQPLLLNDANDGFDWRAHKVCKRQVMGRQEKSKLGSQFIWEYSKALVEKNVEKGNIKKDD